jgi:hypothetical protein
VTLNTLDTQQSEGRAQQARPSYFVGALGGTRTPNLLIRSQMLYPLGDQRVPVKMLAGKASEPKAD